MTKEYEQVKNEALLTRMEIIEAICGDCPFEGKLNDEGCRACQRQLEGIAQAAVDKVLKHKRVRIEATDQSLPSDWGEYCDIFDKAQKAMLTPDSEGNVWVKVKKK